jgi:hypothetical protein
MIKTAIKRLYQPKCMIDLAMRKVLRYIYLIFLKALKRYQTQEIMQDMGFSRQLPQISAAVTKV